MDNSPGQHSFLEYLSSLHEGGLINVIIKVAGTSRPSWIALHLSILGVWVRFKETNNLVTC